MRSSTCMLVGVLCLAPGMAAQPTSAAFAQSALDGARAPAGTWYTRGGCAARSGVSATVLPLAPLRQAWMYTAEGTIESEALVWREHVCIEVRKNSGQRRFELLELASGERIYASAWTTSEEQLEPTLYDGRLLVRDGDKGLELYELTGRSLELRWKHVAQTDARAPLLLGDEIYARVDGGIERRELGSSAPSWRIDGRFRSELAVRGDWLYAVGYSEGYATLRRFERSTGRLGGSWSVGHHSGQVPEAPTRMRIQVLDPQALVYHALPIPLSDGSTRSLARVDLASPNAQAVLWPTLGESVDCEAGWIGFAEHPVEGTSLLRLSGIVDAPAQELAGKGSHPEFAASTPALALASRTCLVGARAFDIDDGHILWSLDLPVLRRAVPVAEGVLLQTEPDTLIALHCGPTAAAEPQRIPLALTAADGKLTRACAVLADGSVLAGSFEAGANAGELVYSAGGTRRTLRAQEVAQLEDGDARVRACADARRIAEWSRACLRPALAQEYVELAASALAAKAPELAQRCVDSARAQGSTDPALERTQKRVAELLKRPAPPLKKQKQELEARELELARAPVVGLARRAATLPAESPFAAHYELLRAALRRDAQCAEALAALRALLPTGLAADPASDPLAWLDFAQRLQGLRVRVVTADPEAAGSASVPESPRALLRAAQPAGRAPLQAFASERALVIGPADRPVALASAMRLADASIGAIERLCAAAARPEGQSGSTSSSPAGAPRSGPVNAPAGAPPTAPPNGANGPVSAPPAGETGTLASSTANAARADSSEPAILVVQLYASRADYLARAPGARSADSSRCGHFDESGGVLHCALDPDDEQLVRSGGDLAFEVARAWLAARQPRVPGASSRPSAVAPSQPARAQPVPAQPVPAQPVPAQPASAQPAPAQPTAASPQPGAPATRDGSAAASAAAQPPNDAPASRPAGGAQTPKPASASTQAWLLDGAAALVAGAVVQGVEIAPQRALPQHPALARLGELRGRLFAWDALVAAAPAALERYARTPQRPPPEAKYLGSLPQPTFGDALRVQAASLCHYLYYAENGKYRTALLRELARCARGEASAAEFAASFGISIDPLALKVLAWAQLCAG